MDENVLSVYMTFCFMTAVANLVEMGYMEVHKNGSVPNLVEIAENGNCWRAHG